MNRSRIQDVSEFVLDGTHGSPIRVESGVPVLSAQNVKNGVLNYHTDRFTTTEEYQAFHSRLPLREGDLLLTIVGTIGRSAVLTEIRPLVFQRSVAIIRPDSSELNSRFFFHATQIQEFQDQLARSSNTSSQAGIYLGKLKDVFIPHPPLPEQRRIADILDRAEALRAKRRAALALLDTLTQSIFLEMFGDLVANTKCWPLKLLKELGSLDRGVSTNRPRNAPELLGGPYPLVQTGEVANCDGYVRSYHSTYSEIGLKQSKMWPVGTLCITIAANIAKTGILTFPACFPDSIVGFKCDELATVEFVRVWLSFLQKRLEDAAPESAQKNINLGLLRELTIPVPPLPLQQEFARRVATVERMRASQRSALAKLDELFAGLQHRAFRGEL